MKNIFVAMLLLVGTFCSAANVAKPAVEAKPILPQVTFTNPVQAKPCLDFCTLMAMLSVLRLKQDASNNGIELSNSQLESVGEVYAAACR
jgi:hypothetical protein